MKRLITGLLFCLPIALLISASSAQAQIPMENADIDITIEPLSDGRCHVTATMQLVSDTTMDLEDSPVTSAELSIQVTSPSSGEIEIDLDISADLASGMLDPDTEAQLAIITPSLANTYIQLYVPDGSTLGELLEGYIELIPELASVTIDEISCTSFSWSSPGASASLSTTLSGTLLENEELRSELPASLEGSAEVTESSVSLSLELESTSAELSLSATAQTTGATTTTNINFDGYFDLPRTGDQVQWDFEIPQIQPFIESYGYENVSDQLKQNDITLTLKLPSDASVSGLPTGAQQDGSTYTWDGDDAADAIAMITTGQLDGEITYDYEPPSELPWILIGLGIVTIIIVIAVAAAVRRK
jgi:hypothetical protein